MSAQHTLDEKAAKTPPKAKTPATEKSAGPGDIPAAISQLQQTVGNAAVQRLLAQRDGGGPAEVDDETAAAIHGARGAGHELQADIAAQAGQAMGQDFSDVHVHTDAQSDQLSRQLGATAFTTGNDLFFRAGAYDPAGQSGRRLIAHELTHVVQQGATAPAVQGKMAVNDPNDRYEAEADRVAEAVVAADSASIQREAAPMEEEEPIMAQRQADAALEEEEPAEVQMQEEDELEAEGG